MSRDNRGAQGLVPATGAAWQSLRPAFAGVGVLQATRSSAQKAHDVPPRSAEVAVINQAVAVLITGGDSADTARLALGHRAFIPSHPASERLAPALRTRSQSDH